MRNKLCLFMLLFLFSGSAFAEYYLVYTPPQCDNCARGDFDQPREINLLPHHKTHHRVHPVIATSSHKHVVHRVASRKPVKLHQQTNACGQCENCICGSGFAVSTTQPEFYGEHCTTYEDQVVGRQDNAGY